MIADARKRLSGSRTGLRFICADLYHLPFCTAALDAVVQIRVLHHVERIDNAFMEVARTLRTGGAYVLEFANKRNLKAILRHLTGKQASDPFDDEPFEFVPPVSYTHLDVYKRQARMCLLRRIGTGARCSTEVSGRCASA